MDRYEFGKHLKALRKNKGLTLKDLEKSINVSNSYISQIENGKFTPAPATLKKLARGLEADYLKLLKLSGQNDERTIKDELNYELMMRLKEKSAVRGDRIRLQLEIDRMHEEIEESGESPEEIQKKQDELNKLEKKELMLERQMERLNSELNKIEPENPVEDIEEKSQSSSLFDLLNFGLASPQRFNEVKNGLVAQSTESFRVNDLFFHLYDPHNKKMYKDVVLSDLDRKNITELIEQYLLRKYITSEEGDHRETLISMLTTDHEIEDGYRHRGFNQRKEKE